MRIAVLCGLCFFRNGRDLLFAALLTVLLHGYSSAQEQATTADTDLKEPNVLTPSTGNKANELSQNPSKIKVVFDENSPGVIFVESNGEKIRVDTTKKTVEPVAMVSNGEEKSAQPDTLQNKAQAGTKPKDKDKGKDKYDFAKGEEPYDYRVVNIPTPKNVPKGTWNLIFTHRFTQPVDPLRDSAKTLLGLDSFGIASFGISYGITDKIYVSAYRSPLCQRGLCRVIEVGLGYNWLAHEKKSPIALTTYASIEGNNNFSKDFTYNLQTMLSGRIGKRIYLFFSPAIHINSNGNRRFDPHAEDFFPPATVADSFRQPTHGASFGFGTSVLITPNVVALFDFVPRTGFRLGQVRPIFDSSFRVTGFFNESHPSIGFGIQRNIGGHAFALTFSNTQTTTTSRYNSSNLVLSPRHLVIGFNLSRRF